MQMVVRKPFLKKEPESPAQNALRGGNRQNTENYFESFGGCLHRQPKWLGQNWLLPPPQPKKQTKLAWLARLRSAHCGPGAQGSRSQTWNVLGCGRAARAERPAPHSSAFRVSAVTSIQAQSPAGSGPQRAVPGESRERSRTPHLVSFPRRLAYREARSWASGGPVWREAAP